MSGLAGSSINFTWSFSGDVDTASWGLKRAGSPSLENNGELVQIKKNGPVPGITVPSAYSGRVSRSGNTSLGHVIFTLGSLREIDERFFACFITPTESFDFIHFDTVYLVVEGEQDIYKDTLIFTCSVKDVS